MSSLICNLNAVSIRIGCLHCMSYLWKLWAVPSSDEATGVSIIIKIQLHRCTILVSLWVRKINMGDFREIVVVSASKAFHEYLQYCTGTFYNLLYVWRGYKALQVYCCHCTACSIVQNCTFLLTGSEGGLCKFIYYFNVLTVSQSLRNLAIHTIQK
jgi:hypothetical protein